MIERLILVAVLLAVGAGVYLYMTRRQVKRLAAMDVQDDPILQKLRPGVPAIVYFTTPGCIPCKTQQQPALKKVTDTWGDDGVQVIRIDATEEPDSADKWGVFAAPTTFVVDATGKTRAVNHGVADANTLQTQLMRAVQI